MELYGRSALARLVTESSKTSGRTEFERDRARLLHSAALRRLGAKTQVRTPWRPGGNPVGDDFIRTRLTHSLEVAQVGRELGKALGCDPEVVDTACLAHDLGHPPFGHNGERALAELADGIGGFEGNAQTLRLLTHLEAKVYGPDGSAGLNLTRASLDATIKYPWQRGHGPTGSDPSKFGVYQAEAEVFAWIRQDAPPLRRCVEAQVMDLADDVAYSVHDVEDGVVGGTVPADALSRPDGRAKVIALAAGRYTAATPEELESAAFRLFNLDYWPSTWDGTHRSLAALKNLTSQLIGRFVTAAEQATRQAYGSGGLTRYAADVVVPDGTAAEIALLKALADVYVMEPRLTDPVYVDQRTILTELYWAILAGAPDTLEVEFRGWYVAASDDSARRRVVLDQVASLTDASAVLRHRRLTGVRPAADEVWPLG
ncbi:MAG: deoxyguanosinetriphosphate triphosphohydrolase [Bifidobacteriaceae bacterium]|jgi:dGTPase|nr:deoxyguanosinetriphosphate triphosphohydrolase [Bifidobacteriaceae bacterium]